MECQGLRYAYVLSYLLYCVPSIARGETSLTLGQLFKKASTYQATIAIQEAQVQQKKAVYQETLSGVLPSINSSIGYTRQEQTSLSPNHTNQPSAKITVTQPLFQGFAEYATIRQAGYQVEAQKENKNSALKTLGNNLAQTYFSILSLQGDIQNYEGQIREYQARIHELRSRIRIGLSRLTEQLTVEAACASIEATLEKTKGNLAAARVNLVFLTGLDPSTSLAPVKSNPSTPAPLTTYLMQGDMRPEVKSAAFAMQSAQEQLTVYRAGHFPSVSAFGDYYIRQDTVPNNARWDVGISLTIPIYSGGMVTAKMEEAASLYTQAELATTLLKDQIRQEISTYYEALESDRKQYGKFQLAAEINRKNLDALQAEYRNGLVTNLDVLTAMTSYSDAKRQLLASYHAIKLDECNLYLAQGKDPFMLDVR